MSVCLISMSHYGNESLTYFFSSVQVNNRSASPCAPALHGRVWHGESPSRFSPGSVALPGVLTCVAVTSASPSPRRARCRALVPARPSPQHVRGRGPARAGRRGPRAGADAGPARAQTRRTHDAAGDVSRAHLLFSRLHADL